MVFSSMIFLWVFLPIVLVLYFISPKKIKNIILLLFSILFYVWGGGFNHLLLLLISICINYFLGILIDKFQNQKNILLLIAIIFNLGLLGYFKYFNFIADMLNSIFSRNIINVRNIILPIGISFYTFQILSYLLDLYRKEIKVQKNILNLALYISFFPQLIAGPIVKYKTIEEEINKRKINLSLFASGIRKFVYGLGKKVIFANTLALITDSIYQNEIIKLNTSIVWLAAIAYTLQIYYDFSGYSDMAIGLGRMFGFHFPENFNIPYISKSITEFWRRWHISLSTWFKQYLYIPLGGNRKGKVRTYVNLWIVFLATGLWHGASLNFIMWGMYYGIFLIVEKAFLLKILDKNKFKLLNSIYVLLVVIVGWVLFRTEDLNQAFSLIKLMFRFDFKASYVLMTTFINAKTIITLILAILFCGPLQSLFSSFKKKEKIIDFYAKKLEFLVIGFVMWISIAELTASTYNPFIYFRF